MDLVSTCLWCTNKKDQVRVSVLIKNKIMASGIRKNNITAGLRGLLHCWDPQKVLLLCIPLGMGLEISPCMQ